MNENLYRLITDFQAAVETALKLMCRSGIKMPSSNYEWVKYNIPGVGELEGGIKYFKHGAGCKIELSSGSLDFDFGELGEVGGFNAWWLTYFAGENLIAYGFRNYDDVAKHMKQALDDGELICPDHDLCYIANIPYSYAINIDSRNYQDLLPIRNRDRVLILYFHYFETANLMFKSYNKINKEIDKGRHLSQKKAFDMRIYLFTWLGFLGVVCEGFKKLNMRNLLQSERPAEFKELLSMSDSIGKLMTEHSDSLRVFRNNIFHLRQDADFLHDFFARDVGRLTWAQELHKSLSCFFSQYRCCCEVHYVFNGRKGESDLIKNKINRRKKAAL